MGNRRRGRMKLGPRRLAAFTAKRLPEGNHRGKEQQPYTFWCKGDTATIGTVGDPTVDDSGDSIPSLVDHSLEHRGPEAVPSEQFPAYMPPRTQVFGYDDGALRFATMRFGHWESGVSLAIVRSARGGAESD